MKTEREIQKAILNYLVKDCGAYAIKTMVTNSNGVPDILCSLNGKFIGIEVKTHDGVVSKIQQHHIKRIKEAGGVAFVARSVDDVYRELNKHQKDRLI